MSKNKYSICVMFLFIFWGGGLAYKAKFLILDSLNHMYNRLNNVYQESCWEMWLKNENGVVNCNNVIWMRSAAGVSQEDLYAEYSVD